MTSILFRSIGESEDAVTEDVADDVARVLADESFELEESDLVGALRLSRLTSRDFREDLRRKVLTEDLVALSAPGVSEELVKHSTEFAGDNPIAVSRAFAGLIVKEPRVAVDLLTKHENEDAIELIHLVVLAKDELRADFARVAAEEGSDVEEGSDAEIEMSGPHMFLVFARERVEPVVCEALMAVYLQIDHAVPVGLVKHWLENHGPVDEGRLSRAILDYCGRVDLPDLAWWLRAVDVRGAKEKLPSEETSKTLNSRLEQAWAEYIAGHVEGAVIEELVDSLREYVETGVFAPQEQVAETVGEGLSGRFTDQEQGRKFLERTKLATSMGQIGLIDLSESASRALGTLSDSVRNAQNLGAEWSVISDVFCPVLDLALPHASTEAINDTLDAFAENPHWPGQVDLAMATTAKELRIRRVSVEFPVSVGRLIELKKDDRTEVIETISVWLREFDPTPNDAWLVLKEFADSELAPAISSGLSVASDRWANRGPQLHSGFVRQVIASTRTVNVDHTFIRAARFDKLKGSEFAVLLREEVPDAELDQLRRLLSIWATVDPKSDKVIRELVNGVYLPICRSVSQEKLELAVQYLNLVRDAPSDRRAAVRNSLRKSVASLEGEGRMTPEYLESRFREAGLVRRKSRALFGSKDEDV